MQTLGVLCFAWTQVHINCNVSEIPNIGGMNKWLYKVVIHILPSFDRNEIYLDFFVNLKKVLNQCWVWLLMTLVVNN
jgi:hypothetical protein